MASLREQLALHRDQQYAGPWYMNARSTTSSSSANSNSIPMGSFRRLQTAPQLQSAIRKTTETFAAKKKRTKDYSSDSSGTERETGDGHVEGRIYRTPKGSSKEFFVYWKGKKISFGDPSMPNRNNNDKARANFNARHNCSEAKDKTSAKYWSCRVWRKGYRGPSSSKKG